MSASVTVGLLILAGGSGAQLFPYEEAKLIQGDPSAGGGDLFGASVGVSGNMAVVGSPEHAATGATYAFIRSASTWSLDQKLPSLSGAEGRGNAVDIMGPVIAVGASRDDNIGGQDSGAAGAYSDGFAGWTESALFVGSEGDFFGTSVSLSANYMVVGAPFDDLGVSLNTNEGTCQVFGQVGGAWTWEATLSHSGAIGNDRLGESVACSQDVIVVGAPYRSTSAGAAFVFTKESGAWVQEAELASVGASAGDLFGLSVALLDGLVVVGAPGADAGGVASGAAYVFTKLQGGWSQVAKLVPGDGAAGDEFGASVAAGTGFVVVGSHRADGPGGAGAGAAYLFSQAGSVWSEEARLDPSDGAAGDRFGASASVSGDTIVIGSPMADHSGKSNAGAAYVFRVAASPVVSYCTAGSSASGCHASVSATGVASASASTGFFVSAGGVEGAKDGLFFFGTNGRQANPWGSGSSYQCVTPPVQRAGLMIGLGTSLACDGTFTQDLNALWCSACPKAQSNPGAGAVVQAQLWYRDPWSTSNQTTSLSDAIEFTVGP